MSLKDPIFYEHRKTRTLLKIMGCLKFVKTTKTKSKLNILYIILVYILLSLVLIQGITLSYITTDIVEKVEAIHYALIMVIIISYNSNELYNAKKLDTAWNVLMFAYNNLNGKYISEEQKDIHRENAKYVKKWNHIFSFLMVSSCIGYLAFAPIAELLGSDKQIRTMPIPLYMPFDTQKRSSYVIGVIWEAMSLPYICITATSVHQSYIGTMGLLRAELELLNYSIKNLEKRALKLLGRKASNPKYDVIFQQCLYICLREDIVHHQLLLRYYNLTKAYLGFIVLLFITLASIILATVGFLITMPNSQMGDIVKFLAIVSAELCFVFQLCWYGERVAEQSENIFRNLFTTPWYMGNAKFNRCLQIAEVGTLKPMVLKTSFFNIAASLETYNNVLTTSFQYFNLLRNFRTA